MEKKDCDENYMLTRVCEERHSQMHVTHEAKHNDVLEKLKSHAEVLKDVDKEVSESFKRVHERIDEFLDKVIENSTEITSLVNQEVKSIGEKVNMIQDKMKSMVIYLLASILISVLGAGVSFILSEKKSTTPADSKSSTELSHKIDAMNDKVDALNKRLLQVHTDEELRRR